MRWGSQALTLMHILRNSDVQKWSIRAVHCNSEVAALSCSIQSLQKALLSPWGGRGGVVLV